MSRWPSTKARLVLAALLRIGWTIKRQSGTSHRVLSRPGWADFVFPFHDKEEIGPRMPALSTYCPPTSPPILHPRPPCSTTSSFDPHSKKESRQKNDEFGLAGIWLLVPERLRPGDPFSAWDAAHLAGGLFRGLDGHIRVTDETIPVTFYNAPKTEHLRRHYEHLPEKPTRESIDPHVSWLYDFKLDFRFK